MWLEETENGDELGEWMEEKGAIVSGERSCGVFEGSRDVF